MSTIRFWLSLIMAVIAIQNFGQSAMVGEYYMNFSGGFSVYDQNIKPVVLGVGLLRVEKRFDYQFSLNFSSLKYPFNNKAQSQKHHLLVEMEAVSKFKIGTGETKMRPYIGSGMSASVYDADFFIQMPLIAGCIYTISNGMKLEMAGKYSIPVSHYSASHYGITLGISGLIHAKRKSKLTVSPHTNSFNNSSASDLDSDGVLDADDSCILIKGLKSNNGCPLEDKDDDGIEDVNDECPSVFGDKRYKGCPIPDTDGDGINDEVDQCPFEKGGGSQNGCPYSEKNLNDSLQILMNDVLFETASSKIQVSSFTSLNRIVQILKVDTTIKILLEGHTDNRGRAGQNLQLSKDRSRSVAMYLVNSGIRESRITTNGYGDTKPIADNDSPGGRALNRRVRIRLATEER